MVNDMDIYYAHTLREVEHYGDYEVVKAKEAQAEIDELVDILDRIIYATSDEEALEDLYYEVQVLIAKHKGE
jgi:hypothetical protein